VFSSPGNRQSPAWSPDGTRLVFSAVLSDGDHADLSLVNPDGTSLEPLTTGFRDVPTAWSPDGTMLGFRRYDPEAGIPEIWIGGADGSGPHELSDYSGPQFAPTWSPDGAWVAFTSENVSGQPLLIARTDGSDVRQVPGTFQFSGQPDWEPHAE
jgi:Tol biopolymer transport system component